MPLLTRPLSCRSCGLPAPAVEGWVVSVGLGGGLLGGWVDGLVGGG